MANNQGSGQLFPFSSKMDNLLRGPYQTIQPGQKIAEGAEKMNREDVDALVIIENGVAKGIVTEQDLVKKALAKGISVDQPIEKIMSPKIITIQKNQPIFDGLMLMISHKVRHLLVMDKDDVVGLVSEHDWIAFQRRHPAAVIHEIAGAETYDEIAKLKYQSSGLAKRIFEREGNAISLVTLFAEINDRVTKRVIELALKKFKDEGKGEPPVPFCWIGMGSEGRKAQTVFTDQDNGIIYDNVPSSEEDHTKQWFLAFAEEVVGGLETCGFPRCGGNIMATNPELCLSYEGWQKLFSRIISSVDPAGLLKASIYFDFRHLYGKEELAENLWRFLKERVLSNRSFLRHMAGNMMAASRPPVNTLRWRMSSLFNLTLQPFDIKRQALAPLVDVGRILGLQCGSVRTNTLERLDDVKEKGILDEQIIDAAKDAYDFVMLLRVRHDFAKKSDKTMMINPKNLNPLQKNFVKEALTNIYKLQSNAFFLIGGVDI